GPLALFMGIPFPYGIKKIESDSSYVVAYAWGVNGFFSVLGSIVVIILSMTYGFRVVFILSAFIYLMAMLVSRKFESVKI
ncbi:MAG: hypothetical protein ACRDFC_02320, partial [Ignavibacteria bacterium]